MKYWIQILLFIFSAFNSFANNNIIFDKANDLYRSQKYDSSIILYKQMLQDNYSDPYLYYNLGNAYYQTHQIGLSIWSYEKAIQLKPQKEFTDNLRLAQKRIKENIQSVDDIFFIRWWKNTYKLMSVNQWAFVALILFLFGMTFVFLQTLKQKIFISKTVLVILFISSFISLSFAFVRFYNNTYHHYGIITTPDTEFLMNKQKILLSEGIKVQFLSQNKDQYTVQLPDGRIGTIKKSAYKKI